MALGQSTLELFSARCAIPPRHDTGRRHTVENAGTSLRRSGLSDESGSYTFSTGTRSYKVKIELLGFQVAEYPNIQLLARQSIRIDGQLAVATAESVSVTAEAAPVITTEVSSIAKRRPDGSY
jgi:hypothetical protein